MKESVPERRQRPIPVTSQEREKLEVAKEKFEQRTGSTYDWGRFLTATITLGLAAAGIYGMAKVIKSARSSVEVQCPQCSKNFTVALAGESANVYQVICPSCETELVVNV